MREALPNGSDHTPQITVFLGWISPLRFFSSPLPLHGYPSIPENPPDDDLNNHYMRGRISQMKPLVPILREEMGKTTPVKMDRGLAGLHGNCRCA